MDTRDAFTHRRTWSSKEIGRRPSQRRLSYGELHSCFSSPAFLTIPCAHNGPQHVFVCPHKIHCSPPHPISMPDSVIAQIAAGLQTRSLPSAGMIRLPSARCAHWASSWPRGSGSPSSPGDTPGGRPSEFCVEVLASPARRPALPRPAYAHFTPNVLQRAVVTPTQPKTYIFCTPVSLPLDRTLVGPPCLDRRPRRLPCP